MTEFYLQEVQNFNSERKGDYVMAKSLSEAKRIASKRQAFYGTTLKISVNGNLVAYKKGNKWTNVEE